MVLTVHHLDNSRSQRILWLLEELQVPYEVKLYQRDAEHCAPKELRDAHLLGTSPVITEDGFVLAESGAIVEYLMIRHGQKREQLSQAARIDDSYFTHYAEGSLMPTLAFKFTFSMIPEKAPILLKPFLKGIFDALNNRLTLPRLRIHAEFVEAHLNKTKSPWFAGGTEPTGADFMMSFPLELWYKEDPLLLGPRTQEFVKSLQERPAYKKALERGGPYAFYLAPHR